MNGILLEFAGRQADAGATTLPESFKALSVNAGLYLKPKMAGCAVGKRLGDVVEHRLNLKKGRITLVFGDGEEVVADAQIAGTYSNDGSYMWAWGHPDTPEHMQHAAWAVQQFGARQEIEELLTRGGPTDATLLDQYLSIAAYISNADGVYCGDHGGGGQVCVCYYLNNQLDGLLE